MWVKICGFRTDEELEAIEQTPPDAIGLNFYAPSSRFVNPDVAAEIVSALPDSIAKVGVFVDQSANEILEIAQSVGLTHIQLHGDYAPEITAELRGYSLIWVYRMGAEGLAPLQEQLNALESLGTSLKAVLIDARVPGSFGGSGMRVDWDLLRENYQVDQMPPLILAGGLDPENVHAAVKAVSPWGVDVASGVEKSGVKDAELCARFIKRARR